MVKFNEKNHTYHMGRERVPSVTQIVGGNLDDFLFRPDSMSNLKIKSDFGKLVHDLCHKGYNPKRDNPAAAPYIEGWFNYLMDEGLKVIFSELMVASNAHRFAGRLDVVCEKRNGLQVITDIKVTAAVPLSVRLQTAGYKIAYEEMGGHGNTRRHCVRLTGTGKKKYQLIRLNSPLDKHIFLCKLASLRWDQNEGGKTF